MRLVFTSQGWRDYQDWQRLDRAVLKRVNRLLDDCLRDPFQGIGKPERLKYGVPDAYSRRITEEHRLVYVVLGDDVVVLQCRYHYSDR
ncbi:MAG TPA: Txe/YoeB family addiction module toxin [Arachnia sp.]|nr:Txe/YoeB family addiction module toxin [Arachnia sp.]HMT85034.1 Txe/YoeB family addiction module toxin [Arachnia sp.]